MKIITKKCTKHVWKHTGTYGTHGRQKGGAWAYESFFRCTECGCTGHSVNGRLPSKRRA